MPVCAVAAVSARPIVQSLADAGFGVVALDVFGDRDTRRASLEWQSIGEPAAQRVDGARLLDALRVLARRGDVAGWVAGGGFEADLDLLAEAADVLPLVGNGAVAMRAVREPRRFFAALARHGIAHPPVRASRPPLAPASGGWLRKDARGTGGWQVRAAEAAATADDGVTRTRPGAPAPASPRPAESCPDEPPADGARSAAGGRDDSAFAALRDVYWQREIAGCAMSATFVADGRRASMLGCNLLLTRRFGRRPYVYCGAIGPVAVSDRLQRELRQALDALVAEAGLRGLGSLDFILDDEGRMLVLELNPRPSASLELYRERLPGGPMRAHWLACTEGLLPAGPPAATAASGPAADPGVPRGQGRKGGTPVGGTRIVYARRPLRLDATQAEALAARPDLHDLPHAGQAFEAGDPLCSIGAAGADAAEVRERLRARRRELLDFLETA